MDRIPRRPHFFCIYLQEIRCEIGGWLTCGDPSLLRLGNVSRGVNTTQNAKLKYREQVPVFNFRILHLRCATATALGSIAALRGQMALLRFPEGALSDESNTPKTSFFCIYLQEIRCEIGGWLTCGDPSLLRLGNVSRGVNTTQNAKLKYREQVPVFNFRILHLRCATATALGSIAALRGQMALLRFPEGALSDGSNTPKTSFFLPIAKSMPKSPI